MLSAVSTPSSARQALRAAGAGDQAELHFGQRDLRRAVGDAVMAAERELEAAAQRGAVDRGDDRLVERLDVVRSLIKRRAGACGGLPNSLMSAPPRSFARRP